MTKSTQVTLNQLHSEATPDTDTSAVTADGGLPISTVFEETGVDRISELECVEDEQKRLYAYVPADNPDNVGGAFDLDATQISREESSVVRIDTQSGTVDTVGPDIFTEDLSFTRVSDGLAEIGD